MTATTNTAPGSAGQNGAHTPGPWVVDEYAIPERSGSALYIRSDERHWAICVAHETAGCTAAWRDVSAAEARANARLIAAAPQMLEALREALPTFEERAAYFGIESGPLIAIRAAIAAATGEDG